MTTKSIYLPTYFICPSCVEQDLVHDNEAFCPVHLDTESEWLAGVQYCKLCEEGLVDDLTIKLHSHLLKGPATFGDAHAISFTLTPGSMYKVIMKCPCEHGGVKEAFTYHVPGFSSFWNLLAAFTRAHYAALKAIL